MLLIYTRNKTINQISLILNNRISHIISYLLEFFYLHITKRFIFKTNNTTSNLKQLTRVIKQLSQTIHIIRITDFALFRPWEFTHSSQITHLDGESVSGSVIQIHNILTFLNINHFIKNTLVVSRYIKLLRIINNHLFQQT